MTVKELQRVLSKESFDVSGYPLKIELADGTRVDTEDIYLDEGVAVLPVKNTETEGD